MNLSPNTPQQRPSSSPVNEPVATDQIAPVKALIDQETKVVLPAEVLEEMPLPSDPKVTFLVSSAR
jgi:hypothetical protein